MAKKRGAWPKLGSAERLGVEVRRARARAGAKPSKWPKSAELLAFRKEFKLNKQAMVDLLKHYGLSGVNWGTYHLWETGRVQPKPLYEEALFKALAAARRRAEG